MKLQFHATTKFIYKLYCQILSYYLWTYLMVKEAQQVSGVAHLIDCRRKPMQWNESHLIQNQELKLTLTQS